MATTMTMGSKEMDEAGIAKVIFRKVLDDVTLVDDERYSIYVNSYVNSKGKVLLTWRRYEEGREDEGYYQLECHLVPPKWYVAEKWVGPSNWEEQTVYEMVIIPPQSRYLLPPEYRVPASRLGLSVRCLYFERLGKIEVDELQRPPRGRVVAQWSDGFSQDGWFKNVLLRRQRKAKAHELILERTWMPRPGYAGSGKQVYSISEVLMKGDEG